MGNSAAPTTKVTVYALGSALAGLIGWWLRSNLPGWDDFPTELLGTVIGGLLAYFVPERQ